MLLSASRRHFRECDGRESGAGPGAIHARARRASSQAGTFVQTMSLSLNWAGTGFVPVAVAEKPKLWLEPGPM
ncbi:hypothetical protein GCM10023096_41500 [Nonomuraea ferruginea]